jgi:APA family basic amino acid/polyamine antiporter
MNNNTKSTLAQTLGPWSAASIVVGTIIGTGIFLKTASMTQLLGTMGLVMLAWIISGILSYAGALTYAELASNTPKSGGEYAILRHGYGDLFGFLFGWMRFWIASPGSIAAYAVGSATFLGGLVDLSSIPGGGKTVAIFFIFSFSFLNSFKVNLGGNVQTFLTFLKVVLILALVTGVAMFISATSTEVVATSFNPEGSMISRFGLAMIAALWAFDGWNNLPMVGDEIKNPQKNIPIALGLGMLGVIALYLAANWAYFHALDLNEIMTANSSSYPDALPVATLSAKKFMGDFGVPALSIAFVISALGAMHGSILTGARVPFAMARDGLFFKSLGKLNEKSNVPVTSIIIQAALSMALALSGTFDQLTDYVVVASWMFYALTTATIFKLRKNNPNYTGFKVPGYPFVPILFILAAIFLISNSIMNSPKEGMIGIGIILAGIPVYKYFKK